MLVAHSEDSDLIVLCLYMLSAICSHCSVYTGWLCHRCIYYVCQRDCGNAWCWAS